MLTWIVILMFFVALSESPALSMMLAHQAKHPSQLNDGDTASASFPLILVFAAPVGTIGMIVWIVYGIAGWMESIIKHG